MEKPHAEVAQDGGSKTYNGLSLPAHCLTAEEVIQQFSTHADDGLTAEEAKRRLEQYGPNQLEEGEGVSVIKIIIRQVANAMMLVKPPISLPFFVPLRLIEPGLSDPIPCGAFRS